MRILTVSHFFESHGGGIERVAGRLCREFARCGDEAAGAASSADRPPADLIDALPLACVNPTERLTGLPMPIPRLGAIRSLAKAIGRSDAVVVHDALYVTSILALIIAKVSGKRTILVQHIAGIPFSSRVLRFVMKLANLLVTKPMLWAADERVFISDTVRTELLGSNPRAASQLIFNGVDRDIFHPAERETTAGRRRTILFVGRYVEKKGMTVLRALAESRPDLDFLLVGNGPINPDGWDRPNVRDLGVRSPREVAELYRSADLLLLPSVGEGYPLVIQEAMACGLPVVCGEPSNRADPGAAKWVRGVAIDLAHPTASALRCADAIDRFSLSRAQRSAMARYAARHYDWGAMASGILALARPRRAPVTA